MSTAICIKKDKIRTLRMRTGSKFNCDTDPIRQYKADVTASRAFTIRAKNNVDE